VFDERSSSLQNSADETPLGAVMSQDKSHFVEQCLSFETTLQTVLIRLESILQIGCSFTIPPDMVVLVESSIASVLQTGRISKREQKVFQQLADQKILEFEKIMTDLSEKNGGQSFQLMSLERSTLSQFVLHLVFESLQRQITGKRSKDFEILYEDQHETKDME